MRIFSWYLYFVSSGSVFTWPFAFTLLVSRLRVLHFPFMITNEELGGLYESDGRGLRKGARVYFPLPVSCGDVGLLPVQIWSERPRYSTSVSQMPHALTKSMKWFLELKSRSTCRRPTGCPWEVWGRTVF